MSLPLCVLCYVFFCFTCCHLCIVVAVVVLYLFIPVIFSVNRPLWYGLAEIEYYIRLIHICTTYIHKSDLQI